MKLVLLDWPDGDALRLHVHVGGGRGQRLGHRGVGAAVHDAHRLAHGVGHLEPPARQLLARLERARNRASPSSVWPIRWPRSGSSVTRRRLSFPAHGHLRPALCRAEGDHRARPQAGPELRPARRHARHAHLAGARAGARGARAPLPRHRRRRRRRLARPAGRLPAQPAVRARVDRHARATCAAPRPPAAGPARCSTRSSSSTRRGHPADPRGRGGAEPRRAASASRKEPQEPRKREPKEPRPSGSCRPRRSARSAAAGSIGRRRRGRWSLLLVVLALWPIGVLTGDDDDERRRVRRRQRGQPRIVGQLVLRPHGRHPRHEHRRGRRGRRARRPASADRAGPAAPDEQGPRGLRGLAVQLPERRPLARRAGHRPAGHVPGRRRAARELRALPLHRRLAREGRPGTPRHSGNSVLRGRIDQIQAPPQNTGAGPGRPAAPQQQHAATP